MIEIPKGWRQVDTIDAHTGGEPLRVIVSGYPELEGETILDKRRRARESFDDWRRFLIHEPRGHADMYGCLLTPPVTPDADVGVLFLHNEGYSTMCGHGIIGLTKVGIDAGLVTPKELGILRIDTPAGRVKARYELDDRGWVGDVSFDNVPSFLVAADLEVEFEGGARVRCDLGYGGAYYAYVDAGQLGLRLEPENSTEIIRVGMAIKRALASSYCFQHPSGDRDLDFLYGTIFHAAHPEVFCRNVCVFADGELDRSPTGTGVSGRAAVLHARGQLGVGQSVEIESLIGSRFRVEVIDECSIGEQAAIRPRVTGRAWITGQQRFILDPEDPLGEGFFLR